MPETAKARAAARTAHRERDWERARDEFREAAEELPLSTEDLLALSDSQWWLGEIEDALATSETVHKQFLAEERTRDAARVAIEIAVNHFLRGDQVLGGAWIARATRLLQNEPESPAHGYLAYITQVEANWNDATSEEVRAAANKVRQIGIDHEDANLVAISLNGEGRHLIEIGEVTEGLRLLDESLAAVVAGDVSPEWIGNIYCNTIAACHDLGDIDRLRRWTDATERWLATMPRAALFGGICRVHRADLLRVQGEWARAEEEAARVAGELVELSVHQAGEGWYQIGEVRRLRGDYAEADEAYRQSHEYGRDPQPGVALLRLAEGRAEAALASIRAALAATGGRLRRARLLAAGVEIAVAADRIEHAREMSEELLGIAGTYGSSGLEAMAVTASGLVALSEGHTEHALRQLRDAYSRWRGLRAPYDAARVGVSLGLAYRSLGDHEGAERELSSAAEEFRRLGAGLDHHRVTKLAFGQRVDGLTDREVEVLALVAKGRTNNEIGEELYISPKTVARHLSNVFSKLDVSSRTEAARYAVEHNLG